MIRALSAFIVFFLWIGFAGAAPATDNEHESAFLTRLLSSASGAVRTESYRGVLVYLRRSQLDTLKVVHRYHGHAEQERLVSLTGAPREVIRDGDKVTSILPQHHLVLISRHKTTNLLGNVSKFSPERLADYYNLENLGERRLAGRTCQVVGITPKDQYRYGYRMLIDQQTHLPLKLDLMRDGHVLEQLMFTEIAFPASIPDEDFLANYDVKGYKIVRHQTIRVEDPKIGHPRWHAAQLPPGFTLAEDGVRQVTKNGFVRQMLFTDGVATVSAFIAPAGLRKPLKGATTMGAVNAFGRVTGDTQITVVGEVPAVTAREIADNLTRREADAKTPEPPAAR